MEKQIDILRDIESLIEWVECNIDDSQKKEVYNEVLPIKRWVEECIRMVVDPSEEEKSVEHYEALMLEDRERLVSMKLNIERLEGEISSMKRSRNIEREEIISKLQTSNYKYMRENRMLKAQLEGHKQGV